MISELWVLWEKPEKSIPENVVILSFLRPSVEYELEQTCGDRIIRAREASLEIRDQARQLYMDIVARIGLVPCGKNRTLRQALARPGEESRWWYHRVSLKRCERDFVLNDIIAVLTIHAVAKKHEVSNLVLLSPPWPVAETIRSAHIVQILGEISRPVVLGWRRLLQRLFIFMRRRIACAWQNVRLWIAIHWHVCLPKSTFDVMLTGFWDWDVCVDGSFRLLSEQYLKNLPNELKRRDITSIGWLTSLQFSKREASNKNHEKMLAPLKRSADIILIEWFLNPWDIIKTWLDFSPLLRYIRTYRHPNFRRVFQELGFDFYPLFAGDLFAGFFSATIPDFELVALATTRAIRRYRPRLSLGFMEHFLHGRAHYAGVKRSGHTMMCGTVRHACYGREKTWGFFHPKYEFSGVPDGCAMPHPDFVCAMGTYGYELFLECGYAKENIYLTGSTRYDYVQRPSLELQKHRYKQREMFRLLMATSLGREEFEMVDAVWVAARDMPDIELILRNHPTQRLDLFPRFQKYKDRVQISQNLLSDDIEQADLVLCTYSTVGCEAFVQGKPTWQWLCLGFNGSPLPEVVSIPQFGSVSSLRKALEEFCVNPEKFAPSLKDRQLVYDRLFSFGNESTVRTAQVISQML